jgi:TonB family protein
VFAQDVEKLPHEISKQIADLHFVVELSTAPDTLIAHFEVEQVGLVVDSIHTAWGTAPRPTSSGAIKPLEVGKDVKAPVVLRRVEAKYTDAARLNRIGGIVILQVVVDKYGVVRDAIVLKPLPFGLDDAAVDAVKQWIFAPGTLSGEPVDVVYNVTVNFRPLDSETR